MNTPSNDATEDGIPCKKVAGKLLVRYDHAAAYRGCSRGTIANDVAARKLRGYRLGRYGYVDKRQLDDLLTGKNAA